MNHEQHDAPAYWSKVAGVLAGIVLLAGCGGRPTARTAGGFAAYDGSPHCASCHTEEFQQWQSSHHRLAERPVAPAWDRVAFDPSRTFRHGTQVSAVDWNQGASTITSVGFSGEPEKHPVARVIGDNPLRQYLAPFPGGRFQVMEASYDPRVNEWFNVNGGDDREPGEWGHWTGRGANWNFMCASCHNTRLHKGYDAATDGYRTTMAEMSVGCEACHGPLRAHDDWQTKFGGSGAKDPTLRRLDPAQVVDTCGECHSRRAELTGDFVPGENFLDAYDPDMVDDSTLYYEDGQVREEDYEYASFLGSRMHAAGVYCLNCHNPHSMKTRLPGNWLCLQCHGGGSSRAPVIDPVAHSHHKVRGYDGSGKLMDANLQDYTGTNFVETGGECINCHMPQTPYMQRHWRHDHGFTIPDPQLTRELGIPNACNRCHQDQSVDWAVTNVENWYGVDLDHRLANRRDRTRAIARARAGDASAEVPLLAALANADGPYWRAAILNQLAPWSQNPAVEAALVDGLGDTNALVRCKAAHVLDATAQAFQPATVEVLRARLTDSVRAVRVAAAWSLRGQLDLASDAGRELTAFLEENADEPAGQMQWGEFFVGRNDLTNALSHYRRAVAWDAHAAPIRRELGFVYSRLGQKNAAVQELREAVRLNPGDAEYHYELALAFNEANELADATAELEVTVRLNPLHAPAWYNLGLARYAQKNPAGALASLERAEGLDSGNPLIPCVRATILRSLGRSEEARLAVLRALALDASFPEARALEREIRNGR